MKITAAQLERIKRDNTKDILLYSKLVSEKQNILDNYGYEESGEEVEKYKNILSDCLETKSKIETGFFHT